jgi:hypothetical protein
MNGSPIEHWGLRVGGLLGMFLAAACGGPEVGDIAGQQLTLQVSGVYLGPEAVASGDERGDFTMSRALISVDSMTLTPCMDGVGVITLEPRVYDLLSDPPFGESVTTAVSEFCGLRVDLTPSPDLTEDGATSGSSVFLEAQDETQAKLAYVDEDSPSLTFTADEGASFGEQPLLLGVDLSLWLTHLAGAATNANPGLLDATLGAALYVDSNGNHALDDDEQTPVAQAALSR